MNIKYIGLLCTLLGTIIFWFGFGKTDIGSISETAIGLVVFCFGAFCHTKKPFIELISDEKGKFIGIKIGELFLTKKKTRRLFSKK